MSGRISKTMWLAAWLLTACGCTAPLEPVRLDLAGAAPSSDVSDLAAVLSAAVTEDGRVAPEALAGVTDRLDRQLRAMVVSGPRTTPELYLMPDARRAYWLNARAAWSLKLAALAGCPRRCPRRSLRQRTFPLDGQETSLEGIDQMLLREARASGDFRLAACAPGVLLDDAPLPTTPFGEKDLPGRLGEALDRLALDERRFVVDIEAMEMRVPPMLWACRDMVLDDYRQRFGAEADLLTALGPHLSARAQQRLEEAVGYRVVAQPGRDDLAVPRPKVFFPGKVGRVEP